MRIISLIFITTIIFSCKKSNPLDNKHYFISEFRQVLNEKYPMDERCDFLLHLHHDNVQVYRHNNGIHFWSEKIALTNKESIFIRSFLNAKITKSPIAKYPFNGIACKFSTKTNYGSISSEKTNKFGYFNTSDSLDVLLGKIINLSKTSKKGKFSSLMYKEILFQTAFLHLDYFQEIPNTRTQIQFLEPVKK